MNELRVNGASEPEREPSSSGLLAERLVELERMMSAERPDAVVLEDDSESALAAALVATKLLIAVRASPAATAPAGDNARLIAQLAGT